MANTPPLKEDIIGSTLEELVKIMDQGPFKLPKLANGLDHPGYSLESTDKYHEAGYDAFITGKDTLSDGAINIKYVLILIFYAI